MMSLKEYQKKRDFTKTPEPINVQVDEQKQTERRFVVQKHQAKRLHWDLRLELEGVLKSWAIPKSPPLKTGVKRLAINVEDHPLDYANFEGTIPEGVYGAGEVKIWDQGTYELTKLSREKITVVFHGEKLKGQYIMIKTKFSENSWILFKMKT